jgi:hypothetical protein
VVLVSGTPTLPSGVEARTLAAMEMRVMELHEMLRLRDAVILHAQERLAAHAETLAPAMGGVTLNRLRLLEDVRDLAEEFARAPESDERRRELMAACDKARRA